MAADRHPGRGQCARLSSSIELGVKFRSSVNGFITGIRFYKGSSNTGTHTGTLWSLTGTQLATVTFSGESASGWQQATFGSPVPVTAGTTYVASYHTFTGFYSVTNNYFTTSTTRGPLTALATGIDGGNGVYLYGASGFPNSTYQATNYWVDVVLGTSGADTVAPTVVPRHRPKATGALVSVAPTATFSEDVVPSSIAMSLTGPGGTNVPGTVSYNAGAFQANLRRPRHRPTSTQYTVRVTAAEDAAGNQLAGAPVTWSFTTAAAPPPPPTQGAGGPVLIIGNTAAATSQFSLYGRDPAGRGHHVRDDRPVPGLREHVGRLRRRRARGHTVDRGPGDDVHHVGARRRPADHIPSGQAAGRTPRPQRCRHNVAARLPQGRRHRRTRCRHHHPDHPVPEPRRPVHAQWGNRGRQALQQRDQCDEQSSGRPPQRRSGQVAAFTYDLPRSIVYTRQEPAWAGAERDGSARSAPTTCTSAEVRRPTGST